MVEFALCMSFLTPLLLGTYNVGMNLGRNLQVTQLARNAGHMYVRWVDFSQPSAQDIVVRMATGLNMARTSGDVTVVLTKITVPAEADCTANGLSASACVNRDIPVIIHRIQFGHAALRSSTHGTPPAGLVGSDGSITAANYLTQTSVRAQNWTNVLTLNPGEVAFLSEVYARSPSWQTGVAPNQEGVYARAIY
jgi:hypothetical protein